MAPDTTERRRIDGGIMNYRPTIPMGWKHRLATERLAKHLDVPFTEAVRRAIYSYALSTGKWPEDDEQPEEGE